MIWSFVLFPIQLAAQQGELTVYADLSGDWRMSKDDRPEYASSTFNDSAWETIRLPWRSERPIGVYWLRRWVQLPATGRENLAVTIGNVNETYEVYLNGSRIAVTPGFGTADPPYFRPRAFQLPRGVIGSGDVLLAIRIWRPVKVTWIRQGYSADFGSYQVANTDVAEALVDRTILTNLVRYTPYGMMVPVNLFLGLYLLLTYRTAREWRELFWLGCFSIFTGLLTSYNLAMASGIVDSNWKMSMVYNLNVTLTHISLAEFSMAAFGLIPGKWRWAVWLTLPATLFYDLLPVGASIVPAGLCVFWGLQAVLRRSELRLTAVFTMLYSLLRLNQITSVATGITFLPIELAVGPVRAPTLSLSGSFLGLTLLVLTTKRLLADKSERQRLAAELEAAQHVQQLLIPAAELSTLHYRIEAVYRPSLEVGGDFYQFLECEDGALVIVLGDVSGKGLKAAMLVALIGALRHEKSRSPGAILAGLNNALVDEERSGFATCCCVRLEPDGTVVVANAGHPPPYFNGFELDVPSALPLGITRNVDYAEVRSTCDGQITLLSDGVVEAENLKGELFGFDRTREISGKSAEDIAAATEDWGQNDDITVVTVRRTSVYAAV